MTLATTPALSIAIALAVGMLAQVIASHLAVPGIILLLAAGILLGPDVASVIQPGALGTALPTLVGFSVAVILFEGGLNLNVRHLRREAVVIRRLVTVGAAVTAVLASVAAYVVLDWDVRTSVLFGTLVIVTGPTVITPLLRRIRVTQPLSTILEAEGILVDAVGALVAVVALEIAIAPTGAAVASGFAGLGSRLLVGILIGAAGGGLIVGLLRIERLVPERLQNVLTLALALGVYQISDTIHSESGIVASIVAGIIVGNAGLRVQRTLVEFKEQLTVLLLGMIFVLLAADVRLADIRSLGWRGVGVVAALMLLVRPVGVMVCARGTTLTTRERLFLSWMAPRGIVAAAVASLFAQTLAAEGLPHAAALRAMVFLVIAATVVVQGLSGSAVAQLLGLRRPADAGYVIVGAGPLALKVAEALRSRGEPVLLVDNDPTACRAAEESGFRIIFGSALEKRTLQRAALETRVGIIALTLDEAVNLLCAVHARDEFHVRRAYVGVDRQHAGVSPEDADRARARMLFGAPRDLARWSSRCQRGEIILESWRWRAGSAAGGDLRAPKDEGTGAPDPRAMFLPLLLGRRGETVVPVDEQWRPRPDDEIVLALDRQHEEAGRNWLLAGGWSPSPEPAQPFVEPTSLDPEAAPREPPSVRDQRP
jgi:NhaP-type Na+/H+ or K+/H+ antiporter